MSTFNLKLVTNKISNYKNIVLLITIQLVIVCTCMYTSFFRSKISEEDSDDLEEEVNHGPGYYEEQEEIKKR